jgi:predicted ATPase
VRDRPVWILAAARHEEIDVDHPLGALLPALESLPAVSRLRLEGLDSGAPERIAQALLGEASAARRLGDLLGTVGALPLNLSEGVNLLADEGTLAARPEGGWAIANDRRKTPLPRTLREVVLRRVALLPTTSRRLLTLAAGLGDRFDAEVLQIADREHPAVIEAGLEILIARWFIRPALRSWMSRRERDLVLWSGGARRGGFEFAQRAVRTILYHHIDAPRRRNMHRRAALALEQLHADGLEAVAGVIGHHFAQAGDWPQAVPHLRVAGDQAAAAGDPDLAARHWGRALQALRQLEASGGLQGSAALEQLGERLEAALAARTPRRARGR